MASHISGAHNAEKWREKSQFKTIDVKRSSKIYIQLDPQYLKELEKEQEKMESCLNTSRKNISVTASKVMTVK